MFLVEAGSRGLLEEVGALREGAPMTGEEAVAWWRLRVRLPCCF